ncbi:acyltransferase family protein [Duganella qianjiadongensis]|uniref:Acyltransferase family protein n=1 Tax=Duganella qianjiadongensis TaxID=2692176 RepID=A0ABW9VLW2_9BURK|nr:acyltransferase [Duganella qianjiadongensis]MYM39474.1 acyltransferase family protein [Duganella qianjiadongensis]
MQPFAPVRQGQHRLDWVQALRAIACLGVVLTHARYFLLDTPEWPVAEHWLTVGAGGVDLFFVISGFIMAYTTMGQGRREVGGFLRRRLLRVWPPLAVMVLLWAFTMNGGLAALRVGASNGLFRTLLLMPANSHIPPYFEMFLPVAWTLVFEVYFYLVFALSMCAQRWRWVVLHLLIVGGVLLNPAVWQGWNMNPQHDAGLRPAMLNVAGNPLVLEFLFGVWAAWLYCAPWKIASERLCWHLLLLVVTAGSWLSLVRFWTFHGPLGWGLYAGALVLTLALISKTVTLQVPRVVLWLGGISYSLYLTHTCTQQLLVRYVERQGWSSHSWDFVWCSTAICLIAAYVYYELVEQRLVGLLRGLPVRFIALSGRNRENLI